MGLLDHVKIENLDEDQRKMVELVGLDGFKSLVRAFGGTTIYIPKAESLERAARDQKIREEFDAIHVHQTEISRYDKDPGKCRIRIQSAVEYLHTLKTPDKKKNVEQEKEQHRFNMELVYIQDITKIRAGETAIGVSCPHCGAPIAGLGDRVCPYCGGAVEPVNVRVWELHRIEEV